MITRTYSELLKLNSFEERFQYLRLNGGVGKDTFGFDRYLNQLFYKSPEWRSLRDYIITRDNGCDLGIPGYEIHRSTPVYIHHLNPISKNDIIDRSEYLTNPEFLITTIFSTHNAIHYGDEKLLNSRVPVERVRNDTCPWRR